MNLLQHKNDSMNTITLNRPVLLGMFISLIFRTSLAIFNRIYNINVSTHYTVAFFSMNMKKIQCINPKGDRK